jgi:phosphoenolpyruvate carboxykinase (ATP)
MHRIFTETFKPKKIIDNPSDAELKGWSLEKGSVLTEFGNLSVVTKQRNRIAKFTEVVLEELSREDEQLVHQVMQHLAGKEMIMVDRVMCQAPDFKKNARLYVTADYPRLPLMWGNTLFPFEGGQPDFTTITVPEWPEKKVLVFPETGTTLIYWARTTRARTRSQCCVR